MADEEPPAPTSRVLRRYSGADWEGQLTNRLRGEVLPGVEPEGNTDAAGEQPLGRATGAQEPPFQPVSAASRPSVAELERNISSAHARRRWTATSEAL